MGNLIDANELKAVLEEHYHFICKDCTGWEDMCADLAYADLNRANLAEANLAYAVLSKANLAGANLSGANLSGANLSGANLIGANLLRTNLDGTDLIGANLAGAVLNRANLYGAYLAGANLAYADLYAANLEAANLVGANLAYAVNLIEANFAGANVDRVNIDGANVGEALIDKFCPMCCPEYGAFIAWKKASGMIVKLQIPEDAKRSSASGRKCRASKAICLAIENADGTPSDVISIPSDYDGDFVYTVGEVVEVEDFDDNRAHECAPGIHFFITRKEAVDYA